MTKLQGHSLQGSVLANVHDNSYEHMKIQFRPIHVIFFKSTYIKIMNINSSLTFPTSR
jgi:hypothetical protein